MPILGTEPDPLDRGAVVVKGQVAIFGNQNGSVLSFIPIDVDLGSTDVDNLDPDDEESLIWKFSATANLALSGIVPRVGENRGLWLYNESSFTITLTHQDVGSAAANRFSLPGASNFDLTPASGVHIAKEDETSGSAWIVLSATGGSASFGDIDEDRILGRAIGAGTGPVQQLTPLQAATIVAAEVADLIESTSLVHTGGLLVRAALTGDVTATQNSNATTIANNAVTNAKLADVPSFSFKGRSAAGTGDPTDLLTGDIVPMFDSTSIIGNTGTGRYERAALTGDVTATQNSNATTIANNAVTNAKAADMVQATIKGRASGAGTGDPTDLTGGQVATIVAPSLASTSVVASGSTLQRAALTGDVTATQNSNSLTIANDAVTNAKLANMAQATIKGRRDFLGTGDPEDMTGQEAGEIIARNATSLLWNGTNTFNNIVNFEGTTNLNDILNLTAIQSVVTGTNINDLSIGTSNVIKVEPSARIDFTGMSGGENGRIVVIINDDSGNSVVLRRADTASANGNRFVTSGAIGDIVLRARDCAICLYITPIGDNANGFWYVLSSTGVIHSNGVLSQSTAVSVHNVDVRDVDVYRITPTASGQFITGMVPREDENHRIFIVNAATTTPSLGPSIGILPLSGSSSANNQFIIGTTSLNILPGRGVQAWYDPTSNKWRIIGQYESTGE